MYCNNWLFEIIYPIYCIHSFWWFPDMRKCSQSTKHSRKISTVIIRRTKAENFVHKFIHWHFTLTIDTMRVFTTMLCRIAGNTKYCIFWGIIWISIAGLRDGHTSNLAVGGGCQPPKALSISWATAIVRWSLPVFATICQKRRISY